MTVTLFKTKSFVLFCSLKFVELLLSYSFLLCSSFMCTAFIERRTEMSKVKMFCDTHMLGKSTSKIKKIKKMKILWYRTDFYYEKLNISNLCSSNMSNVAQKNSPQCKILWMKKKMKFNGRQVSRKLKNVR